MIIISESLQSAAERFAARDKIVEAARTFKVDRTPLMAINLQQLATSGYNSDGVRMTEEDYDFFIDSDCSIGSHSTFIMSLFYTVVVNANNFANGETVPRGSVL